MAGTCCASGCACCASQSRKASASSRAMPALTGQTMREERCCAARSKAGPARPTVSRASAQALIVASNQRRLPSWAAGRYCSRDSQNAVSVRTACALPRGRRIIPGPRRNVHLGRRGWRAVRKSQSHGVTYSATSEWLTENSSWKEQGGSAGRSKPKSTLGLCERSPPGAPVAAATAPRRRYTNRSSCRPAPPSVRPNFHAMSRR